MLFSIYMYVKECTRDIHAHTFILYHISYNVFANVCFMNTPSLRAELGASSLLRLSADESRFAAFALSRSALSRSFRSSSLLSFVRPLSLSPRSRPPPRLFRPRERERERVRERERERARPPATGRC